MDCPSTSVESSALGRGEKEGEGEREKLRLEAKRERKKVGRERGSPVRTTSILHVHVDNCLASRRVV